MTYKGYEINHSFNVFGSQYEYTNNKGDSGTGFSIEDCKRQIDDKEGK